MLRKQSKNYLSRLKGKSIFSNSFYSYSIIRLVRGGQEYSKNISFPKSQTTLTRYQQIISRFIIFINSFTKVDKIKLLVSDIVVNGSITSFYDIIQLLLIQKYRLDNDDLENPFIAFTVAEAALLSQRVTLSTDSFSHSISALKFLCRSFIAIQIKMKKFSQREADK